MTAPVRTWIIRGLIGLALVGAGVLVWMSLRPSSLPEGIVAGNGRIEATEIDIAAKSPGRILDIFVNEGDNVKAGQLVARMDTQVLQAQRTEAEAQLAEVQNAVLVSESQIAQRRSERAAAQAAVSQRAAELNASRKRFGRSDTLAREGATPMQERDDDLAQVQGAAASVEAAKAQLAAADVAVTTATNQAIGSKSRVDAARATIQRINADIGDSELRSPREGRIQHRVAQPGEVVGAGGRLLNLVDLSDVTMTFFLPATVAGRVGIGSEARIVLDAIPNNPIPARISFVSDVAQFTPKTVETQNEREKMMFRVRARIDPALLRRHMSLVKTGLPGMAYVRIDPNVAWPPNLTLQGPPPAPKL